MLSFFIEGTPVPKGRPRFGKDQYGRPRTYTPTETRDWEDDIGWQTRKVVLGFASDRFGREEVRFPFTERVISELTFFMPRPKSYPKKVVVMNKKPDLDNLSKAVLDGLAKARIIKDDNIVTDEINRKRYAEAEGMPAGVLVQLTGWM
jgi:Holliday junction resolvase RusA-like endonuclease